VSDGTAVVQIVALEQPRSAELVTVGVTSLSLDAPVRVASLERPVAVAAFEQPVASASLEQPTRELVF
jgi:hypothetical protein